MIVSNQSDRRILSGEALNNKMSLFHAVCVLEDNGLSNGSVGSILNGLLNDRQVNWHAIQKTCFPIMCFPCLCCFSVRG